MKKSSIEHKKERINIEEKRGRNRRLIFQLLYPSTIAFYVFNIAEFCYDKIISCNMSNIEFILICVMWLTFAIHLISAYLRIRNTVEDNKYPIWSFISDCVEILLMVLLSFILRNMAVESLENIPNYTYMYVVIIIILLNQTFWFLSLKKHDKNAYYRIGISIFVIIGLLMWEYFLLSIWNHISFVLTCTIIAILSVTDDKYTEKTTYKK